LETKRVEASGTAQARTITTQWHTTYRLPTAVAEPLKLTTYTYDSSGNLLTKTEQATTDTTGAAGFNAAVAGTARTWTYTYNGVGQVLTAVDPLGNTTIYTYDTQGNLVSITNALNQTTTLSNYDANGRVGRIVDPNGATTDLAYAPRGWLTSKTVTAPGIAETTSYDYDGAGQLTKVTLPDGSYLAYTYDDAHRLTDVADGAGNHIHYTLDVRGNRTADEVRDPAGVLTRQISRVFDSLSRLQQITGGVQ
jgi:YD repeat-containing protein